MENPKTIVILGGGVGGLIAARELRKRLAKKHRVVLIDRERQHVFAPSLLWLLVGERTAEAIQKPLQRLERKGIEVRHGEIEALDPVARQVTVNGEAMTADFLVVALGAELAPDLIPGLAEAGHNFYTLEGAQTLAAALDGAPAGSRVVVLTAAPAYKCPAAPYEAAMLIEARLRERGAPGAVAVYAAEPMPMGVAGPEMAGAVVQLLQSKQIPYHPEHQVQSVDAAARRLTFANGSTADFDVLAYVPPHRAPKVIRDSALAGALGWVSVDRNTLATQFPGVFAIGDAVSIPLQLGKPLPKAGVFAHGQAEVVAKNIAAAIAGEPGDARFLGHGECFVEIGDGKAAFGGGNFYAEPKPEVKLHAPSRKWHLGKVLFEKAWLNTKL
ncbi:MAG: NAD(P)/FAD-dependent oxidoreductase [Deltaproteobacteria bacterium]|nr:NAD(P)/FAD-dependent oxidoreductase [Deltaproteobacteria bacterium]